MKKGGFNMKKKGIFEAFKATKRRIEEIKKQRERKEVSLDDNEFFLVPMFIISALIYGHFLTVGLYKLFLGKDFSPLEI